MNAYTIICFLKMAVMSEVLNLGGSFESELTSPSENWNGLYQISHVLGQGGG